MKSFKLKKWPLIIATALLLGISAATTTVLASNDSLTVQASVLNVRLGPGLSYGVMGQIPKGTQLTIISKKNSWYQVRLAGNQIGWVASWLVDQNEATTTSAKVAQVTTQANVRASASTTSKTVGTLSPGDSVKVVYQEGNWSQIAYQGTAAWVSSSLLTETGQTTSVTTQQTNTSATSGTSTAAIKVTATAAAYVREAAGMNAGVVTKVAKGATLTVLNESGEWYHVRTSDGKTGYIASWVVSMPGTSTTTKAATSLSEATIVLDPGHGGNDVGAESTTGKYEKTYTLALAKVVGAKLKAQGVNVIYTRTSDTYVDLAPRPVVAEKAHADAFISFHFDSTANPNTASGFTSYYYSASKDKTLATYIDNGFTNLPLTNRGTAYGNFEVLRDNTQPSILLEMGYINSDKDFKYITSTSYYDKIANDIVASLTKYFKAGNHQ